MVDIIVSATSHTTLDIVASSVLSRALLEMPHLAIIASGAVISHKNGVAGRDFA